MKCNWLTIITCLVYLHLRLWDLSFVSLMLQHALACPAWLVQGEKCQFCTFSFSPIQFQFHREWVFDRNLRLNNKFTLHDSFFQRAREWSGEKSKDALYEIEIKMNRDSSLRNVLEMRFPSRDSMTGICAALRDLSMKYLLTLLISLFRIPNVLFLWSEERSASRQFQSRAENDSDTTEE